MTAWLLYVLALPFTGAAVAALYRFTSPERRWSRQLSSDSEIYANLPEGPQKDRMRIQVNAQTERLLDYRDLVPARDKRHNWFNVVMLLALIYVTVSSPAALIRDIEVDGPSDILLTIAAVLGAVVPLVSAVRGRDAFGLTGRQHVEAEGRMRRQVEARRRAAHVRAVNRA